MERRSLTWLMAGALSLLWVSPTHVGARSIRSPAPSDQSGAIYDANPSHIWNRLYRQFYVRVAANGKEYGGDELDPLLWPETEYLLHGPSHQETLKLLDEFLAKRADSSIRDPVKRAMFLRDLWAVFDWLADTRYKQQATRRGLQIKMARIIRNLALSEEQIRALPDNYNDAVTADVFPGKYDPLSPEAPFLPSDLFASAGPWVCLGMPDGRVVAQSHLGFFSGRSMFLVFIQLPGGRAPTLAYLEKLRTFPRPWVPNPERDVDPDPLVLNPELPHFPIGTQMALVRQMMVIDRNGNLQPTHVTESVQLRVYRSIQEGQKRNARASQDSFEFRLSRTQLFSGQSGGLRPIARGEKEFLVFMAHPFDLLETPPGNVDLERDQAEILGFCTNCHDSPGVASFLSYSRQRFGPQEIRLPVLIDSSPAREAHNAASWKEQQHNWGLLEGLMAIK